MGKVISFANHKGGVAKTTIAVSVADAMARTGLEVLIVDMDPQANTTRLVYSFDEAPSITLEMLLDGKAKISAAIIQDTHIPNVHLIGSSLRLSGVQRNMQHTPFSSTSLLRKKLEPIISEYDVIIIDTPPSLELLTANALAASDFVFVPVESGSKLSLVGIDDMLAFITEARDVNPNLSFGGAILTRHDARKKMCKLTAAAVKDYFGSVLTATLPQTTEIQKAQALGQTIIQFDRNLNASVQVVAMAQEIADLAGLKRAAAPELTVVES